MMREEDEGNSADFNSRDEDVSPPPGPIRVNATRFVTFIGKIRTLTNVTALEWFFITLAAVSISVSFGFTVYRILTLSASSDQYIFAIIAILNTVFSIFYLLHGVFQEQPFEILMLILTQLILASLLIIDFASSSVTSSVRLARFICTLIIGIPTVILAAKVGWNYWSSGALIFRTVGADIRVQRMCRCYFLALSFLIFDAQLGLSCTLLFLKHGVTEISNEDIVVIVTGVAFTFLWLTLGYLGMRSENKNILRLFQLISFVQIAFALFLITEGVDTEDFGKLSSLRPYSRLFTAIVFLLAHFTLLAVTVVVESNFGKGLKSSIYGDLEESTNGNGTQRRLLDPLSESTQNYRATSG